MALEERFEKVVFALLLLGLAWVPFWFGSNRPLAWGINAVWFCGLAVLYEASRVFSGRYAVAPWRIWPALFAFGIVVVWGLIQVCTAVPLAYQHPVWQMARDTLEFNIAGSISVNRDATYLALLRLVTAASVFWLSLQLTRSRRRAKLLVQALALIGLVYAIYGLTAFFGVPETVLWFEKEHYLDSLTSTFINRNSYATYAALGMLCAVGLVISAFQEASGGGDRGRRVASLVVALTGQAGLWLAAALIIALALMFTASRGGISAALLGLAIIVLLAMLQRRGRKSPAILAGVLAFVAFVAVAVSFGDLLAARIDREGFASNDRLAVYVVTWTSIVDKPFLGFGYGTFEHVFPMYRDATVSRFGKWDKAHNTYLELFQGLGLPVAAILLLGVGTLVWRCFVGALTRRQSVTGPLVASAASVTVLTHAFVDFSLQMQAVAITWMALLGAGVAQSWSGEIETHL